MPSLLLMPLDTDTALPLLSAHEPPDPPEPPRPPRPLVGDEPIGLYEVIRQRLRRRGAATRADC
jgi:hypothetical protein